MAIRDLLEIVLSYVQYFVLLISISPSPFPSYYQTPLTVLSYVNLDFAQLFNKKDGPLVGQLPSNWPIDVRLQFIAVSVVLPLLLAFTGLLSLAPKQFILWYSVLLCGTFCICIAIFAIAVNDPLVISAVGSQNILVLLYSGIGCIVACVASALIWYMCSRSDVEAKKNRTYEEIMEDEVGAIDCGAVFFRCVYVVVGAFFGLLLIGAFEVPQIMHKGTLGVFGFSLGVVLAFIAFVLFVWTAIGLHRNGRLIQFHIGEVVKNNFLSVLLLLISLLYIPAVTNVVLIINCHDVTCGAHQRFVDGSTDVYYPSNYTSSCEACSFPAQECSGSLQYQLCGTSVTSSRLYFDDSVQCSELQQYFWPASGIMFVSYVLAMPIINYVLTARSTRILASDFPLDMQESLGLTDVEAFEEKVHASDNVAKFIYDPFQLRWRHWRMLFLFQKLTTVLAASFVISSPDITSAQVGLDLSAFIHLICLCYIVFTRPFKRKVENYLTIATQLMLTVGCGIGVVAVNGVSVSDNVWLAAAISAAAVPFLAFVIGAGLTARDSRIKREARERRIQKAIETVEEADEDEVQDLYGDEARDTDDEEEMGTLRGLPSQANLTRRKSLRERAVKKITVKTAQSPKANNMTESSAVARRKEKKKAGKSGDLSPPPLDLGGDITVLSDDDEVSPLHPSGMSPPVKPTIPHPPEDKSRRGAAPSRVVVKVEENKTGCGAPPKHTLGPGHHKSPPPSSLQGPTHNPLAAPIVILPPSLVPAGKGNASSPRNAAFGMMSKRIPNTAAQSARAKHRWAQAKMWVLRKVREEMLRREEEEDAKGNNGSPSSSPRNKKKKMAGWDKLMVMLMKKNATQMAKKHAGRNVTDEAELRKIDSGLHEMASFEQRHSMTEDELKARLRDIYDHHMRKVQDEQKAVDFRINDDITGILHIFFMAIGLFAFIALGCCVLGVIKYSESLYFTGPTAASATKTADTEFVGYLTWIGFTSNCCCLPYSNQTHSTILDLEKWTCSNGQVKERIRSQSNFPLADVTPANTKAFNLTSGLILRPICAADFSYGCTLAVDNVTGAISVQECTAAFPSSTLTLW